MRICFVKSDRKGERYYFHKFASVAIKSNNKDVTTTKAIIELISTDNAKNSIRVVDLEEVVFIQKPFLHERK